MAFQLNNIPQPKTLKKKQGETKSFLQKEITLFGTSFSNKVKEDLYTEIAVLLKAGVTLKDALELVSNSQKKQQNKIVLERITNQIISGQSLSQSIKAQKHFTDYEYYSIKIGEETGTLPKTLAQLGHFFARKNEQRRNLISALTYPAIILTTAVLVVIFMLQFVVPIFQDVFNQQNIELPAITIAIINASQFMKSYSWIFVLLIIGVITARPFLKKVKSVTKFKDQAILKLPFVGNFIKLIYLSQFTQAITLLTASKVPLVNSIRLVKQMIRFYPLQQALEQVENDILKGKTLSNSLLGHKIFDNKMIAMVKVAEQTNQNEFIFDRLNAQYNTQVAQNSKLLSTVIEPFIILFVGILVGVILVAMYLPMFKLSSVLA